MTSRRSFLAGILALGVAPAIVRAASLMPVKANEADILLRDDAAWLQAMIDRAYFACNPAVIVPFGDYALAKPLVMRARLHLNFSGATLRAVAPADAAIVVPIDVEWASASNFRVQWRDGLRLDARGNT